MNSISPAASVTASLDDPFYYLANFRFVLGWVSERHDDLLDDGERRFIADFHGLSRVSQALLARMVMRKGEHFRTTKLIYAEIGDPSVALDPLIDAGWVEADPLLSLDELFRQLRLAELRRILAAEIASAGVPASAGKATLFQALTQARPQWPAAQRRLADWGDLSALQGERVVRLPVMATCDRLRLMFFGNLRQDWSEFVLAELGLQRFERVALSPASRAFSCRDEVDAYLVLHRLRERLEEGEGPETLYAEVPMMPEGNAWLDERRARLLYRLGQAAERGGQQALALQAYAEADSGGGGETEGGGHVDARIRRLRLLERLGEHGRAFELASAMAARKETLDEQTPDERESQALERLLPRLRRRLGLAAEARQAPPTPERWDLCLRRSAGREALPVSVEQAVSDHLSTPQAPVRYVENALITGLFGLLCWPAIFAPLPGAFFHPFHSGPADLNRRDFVARRRPLFEACLAQLEDEDGCYRESILETWRRKQGLASPFVHWETLDETLLLQALANIPAAHLRACFARLLLDPRANRAGLPDLIQFLPDTDVVSPAYRLIEVKGPGDRLQDNQRRWLAYFQAHGIAAVVCHVTWQDEVPGP